MTARISQILTVGLAVYSFLQVRADLTHNLPGGAAANAAKVLLAIQVIVGVVFFLIPFFPESVHFGSRRLADYTPAQLKRIMPLLRDMVGLMSCVFAMYFAVNIHVLISQAFSLVPREAARAILRVEPWLVGTLLVGESAIIFYYLRRFDTAIDSDSTDGTSNA